MNRLKKTDYQEFTTKDMSLEKRRQLDVGDIWSNTAKCKKCETVIRSVNRHDYNCCPCGAICVDGGSWYAKRTAKDLDDVENQIEMYKYIKE